LTQHLCALPTFVENADGWRILGRRTADPGELDTPEAGDDGSDLEPEEPDVTPVGVEWEEPSHAHILLDYDTGRDEPYGGVVAIIDSGMHIHEYRVRSRVGFVGAIFDFHIVMFYVRASGILPKNVTYDQSFDDFAQYRLVVADQLGWKALQGVGGGR
jgi:hypothetical protein